MKKLLILQHVPHEHPGYMFNYVSERGIALDVIKLWEPYVLPDPASYAGIVVLGGPMGAYEEYPSKNDELVLIEKNLGTIPMLGICLGSQLIAHALGARVYPNEKDGKRIKEIGYYDITLTEASTASPVFAGFPSTFKALEWHGDVFDLPVGSSLLASSTLVPYQAFSFKNVFGFLFHFEFTSDMVENQLKVDAKWAYKDFELDDNALIQQAKELAPLMKRQCYRLMDNFLS